MQYNNTLDIINVDSKYIDYLRSFPELSGVMEHKADVSATGGRKYAGVILSVDNKEYFILARKMRIFYAIDYFFLLFGNILCPLLGKM
jgi:hypothetical protein